MEKYKFADCGCSFRVLNKKPLRIDFDPIHDEIKIYS